MTLIKKYQKGKLIDNGEKFKDQRGTTAEWVKTQAPTKKLVTDKGTASGYSDIDKWNVGYDTSRKALDINADQNRAIITERDKRIANINKFRDQLYTSYDLDPTKIGVDDYIDINALNAQGKRKVSQRDLNQFYDDLKWKQAYAKKGGFKVKQYYGDVEAEKQGYTTGTPLKDLRFGRRFLTGTAMPAPALASHKKGGLLKYKKGGSSSCSRILLIKKKNTKGKAIARKRKY